MKTVGHKGGNCGGQQEGRDWLYSRALSLEQPGQDWFGFLPYISPEMGRRNYYRSGWIESISANKTCFFFKEYKHRLSCENMMCKQTTYLDVKELLVTLICQAGEVFTLFFGLDQVFPPDGVVSHLVPTRRIFYMINLHEHKNITDQIHWSAAIHPLVIPSHSLLLYASFIECSVWQIHMITSGDSNKYMHKQFVQNNINNWKHYDICICISLCPKVWALNSDLSGVNVRLRKPNHNCCHFFRAIKHY